MLRPKGHLIAYPGVSFPEKIDVDVSRLSDLPIDFKKFNVLVLDVQGYELEVLHGAAEVLHHFDAIIAEVQVEELYERGVLLPELESWLLAHGYTLQRIIWSTSQWGNALFRRRLPAGRSPTVHAFISSWLNLGDEAQHLFDRLAAQVEQCVVLSAGHARPGWIDLGEDAFFGAQWNRALAEFDADVLLYHQADARLLGDDYRRLLERAREVFRTRDCGIYAPNIDYTAWAFDRASLPTIEAGLHEVVNTDCTCWMVHRDIIDALPRHFDGTQYGWGIDILYCEQSLRMGRKVLRDYRYLVDHPRRIRYSVTAAEREMRSFLDRYREK